MRIAKKHLPDHGINYNHVINYIKKYNDANILISPYVKDTHLNSKTTRTLQVERPQVGSCLQVKWSFGATLGNIPKELLRALEGREE